MANRSKGSATGMFRLLFTACERGRFYDVREIGRRVFIAGLKGLFVCFFFQIQKGALVG